MYKAGVSWGYFVGPGTCNAPPCPDVEGSISKTVAVQNPLPGFRTVEVTGQLDNVRPNTEFFEAAAEGNLPAVSWVMPTQGAGEHPPDNIAPGQAWVTQLVNAVMEGPASSGCTPPSSSRGTTGAGSTTTSSPPWWTRTATGSACPAW